VIVLATILIAIQWSGGSGQSSDQAFFTIDDGQTWFADDISNLPPYFA